MILFIVVGLYGCSAAYRYYKSTLNISFLRTKVGQQITFEIYKERSLFLCDVRDVIVTDSFIFATLAKSIVIVFASADCIKFI